MKSQILISFSLLFVSSVLVLQSRAKDTGSIFFLDSANHRFLRTQSDAVAEVDSLLLPEVGAAVSVLLGFAPPATLSSAGSTNLNKVLMPNPFHRPRAVFMLDVKGVEVDPETSLFSSSISSKVIIDSNTADIQLPDEDEVSVVSLNELSSFDSDADFTDEELNEFASLVGGSYVTGSSIPSNGELIFSLPSGGNLNLHMSKKADKEFTASLVSLIRNIRRAMEMHQDFSGSMHHPAELLTGSFDGIKALQEQYGPDGIAQKGAELVYTAISKIFELLHTAYKGEIVGVVFVRPPSESETIFNVMFASRPSLRWLEETETSPNSTEIAVAQIALVRTTLAWITGIILLISTFLGIYFLMNMPLTRDTLLYSNVKLD